MSEIKRGAILSYTSLVLSSVTGILYTPVLVRTLGHSEYGLYSLISSIIVFLLVLDCGFNNAVIRYVAECRSSNQYNKLYSILGLFTKIYLAIAILSLLVGGILYLYAETIWNAMTPDELRKLKIMIILLTVNISVAFPFNIFTSIIQAYEKFTFDRILNIIRVLMLPLIMIPLLTLGYKAISLIFVMTIINLGVCCIRYLFCKRILKIKITFKKVDPLFIREIINFSIIGFTILLLDRLYWATGNFILSSTSGTKELAVYAIALQIVMYYLALSTAISSLFLPRLTEYVTKGYTNDVFSDLFIQIGRLQAYFSSLILIGYILFGKYFIQIWVGLDYIQAYYLSLIIMVPYSIPLMQNIGRTMIQAKNVQKYQMYVYGCIALLTIILSIILCEKFGAYGCAYALSIAIIGGEVILMNYVYHKQIGINIKAFWVNICKIIWPILVLGIISFGLIKIHPITDIFQWVGCILIFSICSLFVLYKFSFNQYEKSISLKVISSIKYKIF